MRSIGTVIKSLGSSFINTASRRQFGSALSGKIVTGFAVAISVYHLSMFTIGLLAFDIMLHRVIHLTSLLMLTFLIYSVSSKKSRGLSIFDIVLVLACLAPAIYMAVHLKELNWRPALLFPLTGLEAGLGILLILLVFEATRRVAGMSLSVILLILVGYSVAGPWLPGIWAHQGRSIGQMVEQFWLVINRGVWSEPLATSATAIFLYVLFGQVFFESGAGEIFIKLANSLVGHMRGGPAKASIIGSALFGTMSGSAAANVGTTGSITIPMMKNLGYEPHWAAGIEVTASVGGMFTPPIMAGITFIMSSITGIPYSQIALACIIPAFLYYLCLFAVADFEAARLGLKGIPMEERPSLVKTLKEGWQFFLPLALLVYLLMIVGMSPLRSALYVLPSVVVVSWFRKSTRMGLAKIVAAFAGGAKLMTVVAVTCAVGGMMMDTFYITGLAGKFGLIITSLSGGGILPALLLAFVACIFLGLALPVIVSYLLTALLVVPATVSLGVPMMAAHLFAIYYACLSLITPPVGGAFFVAASIAGANPMRVGFTAMRLAIAGFIVPFFFVYEPALLALGSPVEIGLALLFAIPGVILVAAGVQGWLLTKGSVWQRILLFSGGILLFYPNFVTHVAGLAVVAAPVVWQWWEFRKTKATAMVSGKIGDLGGP